MLWLKLTSQEATFTDEIRVEYLSEETSTHIVRNRAKSTHAVLSGITRDGVIVVTVVALLKLITMYM